MGLANDYKDKAKGKLKQVQGSIQQKQGGTQGAKGGLRRMEGKVQEVMADARIALEKNRNTNETDDRV